MDRDEDIQKVHLASLKNIIKKLLDELGYEIRRDDIGEFYLGEQSGVYPA